MKQKTYLKVLILGTLALLGVNNVNAGAGHRHSEHGHEHATHSSEAAAHAPHQPAGGPNGGRLIKIVVPHLEFFVTPERFVQITFLGRDGQVVPVADQVVSAIGGDRSAPTKVEFVEDEGRLISTAALPEMKRMPIILQIKTTPDATPVRETFYLNMSGCPSCEYKEYACICGH
jgi:hypothetical protein